MTSNKQAYLYFSTLKSLEKFKSKFCCLSSASILTDLPQKRVLVSYQTYCLDSNHQTGLVAVVSKNVQNSNNKNLSLSSITEIDFCRNVRSLNRHKSRVFVQTGPYEYLMGKYYLSYDVAGIQWITSCHKNRMTTRVIALWRVCITSLTTSMSTMRFHIELISILKAIKSLSKGHMINRILHSWPFHMKFIKLAKGSFHKFHMK